MTRARYDAAGYSFACARACREARYAGRRRCERARVRARVRERMCRRCLAEGSEQKKIKTVFRRRCACKRGVNACTQHAQRVSEAGMRARSVYSV